jgi:hypothetical protein
VPVEPERANDEEPVGERLDDGEEPTVADVEHGVDESVADLVEELGRDAGTLVLWEAALASSRRVPELRRAAVVAAAAVVVVLAFAAAFALANWAAVSGLSALMPTWLAALVLAAGWAAVGVAILVVLLTRVERASGIEWWRMVGEHRDEVTAALQGSRDEAEQALRDTIDRLAGAIAGAAADQIVDVLNPLGDAAADVGENLLEMSEDVVEALEEQLPSGGAVGQVIDVVLFPGRLGLRIATTVLKGAAGERPE